MQLKTINPMNLLVYSTETKVTDLEQYVGIIGHRLHCEAAQYNMRVIGPQYWLYDGFDGDENKFFTLEIAIPVEQFPENYTGEFQRKSTEAFKCVTTLHEGDWRNIPETYGKLFGYIQQNGLTPTAKNREIYIHADIDSPENLLTMIQMGVE